VILLSGLLTFKPANYKSAADANFDILPFCHFAILISIDQAWPKCSPQAVCGPPDFFAALALKVRKFPTHNFLKKI
jgi:hypothetical protein